MQTRTTHSRYIAALFLTCFLLQIAILILLLDIYDSRRKTPVLATDGGDLTRSRPGTDATRTRARHQEGMSRFDQPVLSLADRERQPPASDERHATAACELLQSSSGISGGRSGRFPYRTDFRSANGRAEHGSLVDQRGGDVSLRSGVM